VTGGWVLGLLLSAPYLLPLRNYTQTSQRLALRQAGDEERPPGGLANLPQVAFAEWFGTHRPGTVYFATQSGNLHESAACGSAGVLALLVAAPLAWIDRRRRGINGFLAFSAAIGLLWVLGIPGAVTLLRLPGLNLLSHNRLTFLTSFAVLALAATGLNNIWANGAAWRGWFWLPLTLLVLLGLAAVIRAMNPPEQLSIVLKTVRNADVVRQKIAAIFLYCGGLCAAGVLAWALLGARLARWWCPRLLGAAMMAELLLFAYGYHPQCDPALYYPRLAVLEAIQQDVPGRVLCVNCLPANLHLSHDLHEVRGYDAIDPRPILDVLDLARDPTDTSPGNARTQKYRPRLAQTRTGELRLPPVLDMLGVRYLVFPGRLPLSQQPRWSGPRWAVYVNQKALPRVYVPLRTVAVREQRELLDKLATFDAEQVAFVDTPQSLPSECRGTANISAESPGMVSVTAEMNTAGLLVLADQWAAGWTAEVDGTEAPVLKTNAAVRGVVLPPGSHTVVFRYHPPGLTAGMVCLGAAALALLAWCLMRRSFSDSKTAPTSTLSR
jgi:hypothetical protein